jgi:hypothetical protein
MSGVLATAPGAGTWHRYRLDVNGSRASAWVDGAVVTAGADCAFAGGSGFVAMGTVQFGHFTDYDNLELYSARVACSATARPAAGDAIKAVSCASEVGVRPGGQFTFSPANASDCPLGSPCASATGAFALAADASLCLAVGTPSAPTDADWPLVLAPCAPNAPEQTFTQAYSMLYSGSIVHTASKRFVELPFADIGTAAVVRTNSTGGGQFVFVGDEQEIVTVNTFSVCLGTCAA